MAIAHFASLAGGSFLMVIAIIWSIAALVIPTWQVVDLTEYQSLHEHGLWQDCTRTQRTGIYEDAAYQTEGPLHCTYKFDYSPGQLAPVNRIYVDENSPAGENDHHTWHAYQVSTLVLIVLSIIAGIIAVCISCVALRHSSYAVVFTILSFACLILTFVAVATFFVVAHREDNRFVKGIVGTYEASVGLAYYVEVVSCLFHFLAFVCGLLASYVLRRTDDADGYRRRESKRGEPLIEQTKKYAKIVQVPPTNENYYPSPSPRCSNFHELESDV